MKRLKRNKKKSVFVIVLAVFIFLFLRERTLVLEFASNRNFDEIPNSDCGVVLTGSAGRIREAFEVLAQKKINKLIVSGVYKDTRLREIFPHLDYYPEINPQDIILEKISGSTYENAVQSLQVAETLKCKNILLMTSQLHMYRAQAVFKSYFPGTIEIRNYAVVSSAGRDDAFFDIWFESFKSLFYSIVGLT